MKQLTFPRRLMIREKFNCAFRPEVPFEQPSVGLEQINHNQTVQRVGERCVYVETDQFSTQFQVLTQQHGHAFPVEFDIGDESGKFLNIPNGSDVWLAPPGVERPGAKRAAGANETSQVAGAAVLLQKFNN